MSTEAELQVLVGVVGVEVPWREARGQRRVEGEIEGLGREGTQTAPGSAPPALPFSGAQLPPVLHVCLWHVALGGLCVWRPLKVEVCVGGVVVCVCVCVAGTAGP